MKKEESKYERAIKRVKELKGFYNHLKIFLIVNGTLFLLKSGWLHLWLPEGFPTAGYYFDWINANVLIWLLILMVHFILLHRNKWAFSKKWEEKQIQKFMEKESDETKRYKEY
ncbi:2TM domain-containing protein [Croceitalea rosinachiae]|uniref:2TM domain-containing protein n=1 Tax=Croceitalea rosinachiae TaxID=3075596 RepID=A0ABU3AA96_9FLAO|nr:2TM domain-containing protein [Croceitalea sp. F388]MDT0607107.1 2TM domain-containing protein [Croceitalea sp. F388]